MTNPIVHVQASGLWKAKAVDVEAALRAQMAQAHVITLTEADKAARRATIIKVCKARGWGYQLGGAHAADDCGVIWDERRFEKVYAAQVTCKGDRGKGDPKASCVVLHDKLTGERILVSAMHLPHAVDLAGRWRPGSKYISRWKAEAASWLAETARIAAQQQCAGTILSADWNINIKSKHFQDWFKARIAATPTLDYKRLPKGGTLGYRLIDFAMNRGRIKITGRPEILPKTKASDHRAIKTVLEVVPAVAPKPIPPKEAPVATSQNGWRAYDNGRDPDLVAIPRVDGRVRRGDVATIFAYLVDRFDGEVEDVDEGRAQPNDDWGWAGRPIRGKATGLSNHSSGTAIDLNATQHPLGKRGTFSAKQVKAINRILDDLDGVIRWGGNYSGRPDEMHFEINASAARAAAVAKRLKAGTTSQKDWFDMATKAEKAELRAEVASAIREMKFPVIGGGGKPKEWTLAQFLHNLENDQDNDRQLLREIKATVDALLAANSKGVK